MKVVITAREAMDRGVWDQVCDLKGLNPWCVNEGAPSDMEITRNEADDKGEAVY